MRLPLRPLSVFFLLWACDARTLTTSALTQATMHALRRTHRTDALVVVVSSRGVSVASPPRGRRLSMAARLSATLEALERKEAEVHSVLRSWKSVELDDTIGSSLAKLLNLPEDELEDDMVMVLACTPGEVWGIATEP